MACLGVLLALAMPRFIMVVLWLFGDYLSRAYDNFLLPFLGFFFLPTTTLAYAVGSERNERASSLGARDLHRGATDRPRHLGRGARGLQAPLTGHLRSTRGLLLTLSIG
ncbi:MAG: hypothetical protein GEU71_05345 [Actinobacteria bacterium]|nr:hypothetical protein [Actinomycetota bacterium]